MKNKTMKRLISSIRSGVKKCAWLELFDSGYIYPCEQESILRNLEGEDNVTNVEDYLLNHDKDFLNKHVRFRSIIDNEYLNPYKKYRLLEYYVKTDTFNKLDILFDFKNYPDLKRNIVLVGEKGSGKTAFQNCWLYENNNKLENNNIFWVRCDGHKLYKQWLGYLEDDALMERYQNIDIKEKLVTIEEYLDIQLLYVFSKYCVSQNRQFFIKIVSDLERDRPQFDCPTSRKIENETCKIDLYNYIKSLSSIIIKEEIGSKNPQFSYAFDRVMKISFSTRQLEKRKWIACSQAFQNFLKKNGYWILRIVDGIDNLHINDESSRIYYNHMLIQAVRFSKSRPIDNHIHLMAIRERTYVDISAHYPILRQTREYHINDHKITSDVACFKRVSLKRHEYAVNNGYFKSGELYENIAAEVIKSLKTNDSKFYHNNTRSFLYNRASLIASVYYRLKQLKHETNIGSHVKILENRNRFLNGRLFLSTRSQFEKLHNEVGLCSMNIFYFDSEIYPCYSFSEWHGLCKTRILQLLLKYSSVDEITTHNFISMAFGYPSEFVKQNINDLRAFGMIDSVCNKNKITYILSDKGKYEYEKIFSDIDILYYFGLDSFLPKNLVDNGFIFSHSNKFERKTNYPIAAAYTVASFIIFLTLQNEKEINHYGNLKEEISKEFRLKLEENDLKLPFQAKVLIRRISNMFDPVYHNTDYAELNEFLSNEQYFF